MNVRDREIDCARLQIVIRSSPRGLLAFNRYVSYGETRMSTQPSAARLNGVLTRGWRGRVRMQVASSGRVKHEGLPEG